MYESRDKYMTEVKKEITPIKKGKKEFEFILQKKNNRIQLLEEWIL
ncbi:MAG: hypothetical protein SH817_03815 [Leptospira sp.]|nr:hypothetical protein [Leptospira sp.]